VNLIFNELFVATLNQSPVLKLTAFPMHVKSKKGKGVDLYSASRVIASNAFFVTNQSRTTTATACSLQTQASAAAG